MLGAASTKMRALVCNMLKQLNSDAGKDIPVHVLMATEVKDDEYRKPATGMWKKFVNDLNEGVEPNLEDSFFVGDAAGREGDINDGSSSDKYVTS